MTGQVEDIAVEDTIIQVGDNRPYITYYRSGAMPDPTTIEKLKKDTGCFIDVCSSWTMLITQLSILSNFPTNCNVIVLVDYAMLENMSATMNEIVSMISTLHRVFTIPKKMCLAVVVEGSCNLTIMKSLQETDIVGIVPCAKFFGYDKTKDALDAIMSGKQHWPKDIIDSVSKLVIVKNTTPGIRLTGRQSEVLALVCKRGLSNKKIAQVLKISESTVKIHMSAILKEYGVRNRTQLALAANLSLKA